MSSSRRLEWIARLARAWVSSRRTMHLAGLHGIAVVDEKLADDAARRVLNLLDVGVDDDHAGSHDGPGQLRGGRPAADAHAKQRDGGDSGDKMRPDRSQACVFRAVGMSCILAKLRSAAAALRGAELSLGRRRGVGVTTSSRFPNARVCPLTRASTRSTAPSTLGLWAMTMTMPSRSQTPRIAFASAISPSMSRLELGSSRMTRNGSP